MSSDRNRPGSTSTRSARKEDLSCGKCDKEVARREHGLKCDMCEMWHHTACEGVSEALYKAIQDNEQDTAQGLHWFCRKFSKFAKGFMAGLSKLAARQDALEEKVNHLEANVTEKINIADKTQEDIWQKLDNVVGATAGECFKEMEDRGHRRNSVIFFGVQESTSSDPEVRKEEDKKNTVDITRNGLGCNVEISHTRRLGAKDMDTTSGKKVPRPLLVKVQDQRQAQEMLRSGRRLRDHEDTRFQAISVRKDVTFLEREEMRKLVSLRNQKRAETETHGGDEVWMIRRNKVVNIARTGAGDNLAAGKD